MAKLLMENVTVLFRLRDERQQPISEDVLDEPRMLIVARFNLNERIDEEQARRKLRGEWRTSSATGPITGFLKRFGF